jgi:hypothetical protein
MLVELQDDLAKVLRAYITEATGIKNPNRADIEAEIYHLVIELLDEEGFGDQI